MSRRREERFIVRISIARATRAALFLTKKYRALF
jgi:hypothetical protein